MNVTQDQTGSHLPALFSSIKGREPSFGHRFDVFIDQISKPYVVMRDKGNSYALGIGSGALNSILRHQARTRGEKLKQSALDEINADLAQDAEEAGHSHNTWNRVAPIDGGVEIDLGDDDHTRIRIANGTVATITTGSEIRFRRYKHSLPIVAPAPAGEGNVKLLKNYVNLDHMQFLLFMAWLSYTLAHPKVSTSKYVILQILGGQGTGKSMFTKLIKRLIDPAVTDAQIFPTNAQDLGIAAQQSHVLCYDNLRDITKNMSDMLCIAATGGTLTGRKLYSNDEQHVIPMHVAFVLNGIHSFVSQPDLAQRCLPLSLKAIPSNSRKSESEMERDLMRDLPIIQRGLFDLIAKVQLQLPNVVLTSSERMIDFCRWLGAMELVDKTGPGIYQACYSDVLNQGQRDTLLDNGLAAALLEFGEGLGEKGWSGTPTQLLQQLNFNADIRSQRSKDWPDNAVALSKRLLSLQAALSTQGIRAELRRGKERVITITKETSK